jgi:hypothetical protein
VTAFAPENKYSKFSVVTSNMIVIGINSIFFLFSIHLSIFLDCLMVVDNTGTPQDLTTVLTNGETNNTNGQTTFNKVRIDENRFK